VPEEPCVSAFTVACGSVAGCADEGATCAKAVNENQTLNATNMSAIASVRIVQNK